MSRGRISEVVLTMLGAVFLLIAAASKHPYGFYMVLRLVITVGAVYWAWRVYKTGLRAWIWAFVAVALLLNPFLPIRMQRTQWQPIDLYLGIFLIGWSGYWLFRKRTGESEIKKLAEEKAKEINEANQILSDPQERLLHDQQLDAHQQTQAPQRQPPTSSQDGQAHRWPGTGPYQKTGSSTSGPVATAGTRAASPMRTLSAGGWWTDSRMYSIAWTAMCLLLGGSFCLAVPSPNPFGIVLVVFVMIWAGIGAWWTDSTLYRIAWTVVCLLLGGVFSLAVSSPDSGLGKIIVFALAFGGFACTALLWSRAISKALSKIGISNFAMWSAITWLILCAILNLNFVGSHADRSSTPETQLGNSVSGTSALPVQNQNNASDASKRAVTNGVSGASAGCHPPVFSQQDLSALKLRATNGNAEAQCMLGDSYNEGKGVPQDYTQAAFWWRKAAEQGDADAQDNLGYSYGDGQGVPKDDTLAVLWWSKAAEQGLADAQNNLGVSYDHGEGAPQDYAQAALWYRRAAEQGDALAQHNLGDWYKEGKNQGVPQDDAQTTFWRRKIRAWRAYINSVDFHHSEHWRYAQAAFWYRKAAEQGSADAQDDLGDLYYSGQGVRQDYAQAAFWYRKAAEQGDADAQNSLGNLYSEGQGVPQDYAQAALWYHKAAEQGDADAQDSLGDLYLYGQSVPRDYAEAYFWYDLAAAGEKGTPDEQDASDAKPFAKGRDEAASHLTPADLFREQGRAWKWFEEHQAKPQ